MTKKPAPLFEGLRILEFGMFVAGPYAAELFAHGGADVIKVEPTDGDATRFNSTIIPGEGRQYIIKARGKRGVPLNLGHPDGAAIAQRLALNSDVVISNMRPGTLKKYGLDYDTLSPLSRRIIVAEITAFGLAGPNGGRGGADFQAQAASGMLLSTGAFEDDEPRYADAFLTDYMAGTQLAFAIAAALWQREKTGLGQQVSTTLFQAGIALQHGTASIFDAVDGWKREFADWVRNERPTTKVAAEHRRAQGPPTVAGVYRTADDRWLSLRSSRTAVTRLLPLLGLEDANLSETKWDSPEDARGHVEALRERIKTAFRGRQSGELVAELQQQGIACVQVEFLEEALLGEQAAANGFVYSADHPAVGPMLMPAAPVSFGGAGYKAAGESPAFGQHLREVLGELGYSDDEISALIERGAVAEELPDPERTW